MPPLLRCHELGELMHLERARQSRRQVDNIVLARTQVSTTIRTQVSTILSARVQAVPFLSLWSASLTTLRASLPAKAHWSRQTQTG